VTVPPQLFRKLEEGGDRQQRPPDIPPDKLKGLLQVNADGHYELTDDGKEALRLVSVFSTYEEGAPRCAKEGLESTAA
jgi:hypothetical protein